MSLIPIVETMFYLSKSSVETVETVEWVEPYLIAGTVPWSK